MDNIHTPRLLSHPTLDLSPLEATNHLLYTLWLFTYDQIYDVIIPGTVFALCASLSSTALSLPSFSPSSILLRIPLIVFWLWVMVLQFCLHNQRHTSSIDEDKLNKPWRPLPSGRITQAQKNQILGLTYVVSIPLAHYFGAMSVWMLYTALVLAYNEFGGSDMHGVVRNSLNAGGYLCFFSNALQVAIGPQVQISREAWSWIVLLITALFTTFHSQDFRDEVGDAARGRKTVISALGNTAARWSLVVGVSAWSVVIPYWFGVLGWQAMMGPGFLAAGVVRLTLMGVGKQDRWLDSVMYRVWCVWMVSLCPMPLFAWMAKA